MTRSTTSLDLLHCLCTIDTSSAHVTIIWDPRRHSWAPDTPDLGRPGLKTGSDNKWAYLAIPTLPLTEGDEEALKLYLLLVGRSRAMSLILPDLAKNTCIMAALSDP